MKGNKEKVDDDDDNVDLKKNQNSDEDGGGEEVENKKERKHKGHGHSHGGSGANKKATMSTKKKIINFILLFLIVPVIYSVPFILKKAGEIVSQNRLVLIYIWSVFLVILFGIVYLKRKLLSISSFVNQNLIWLIFSLGVFIVLDIPKMIQQVDLRQEVLYVWCTLTMIPNLIVFFFDDTDYKTQERIEEEKEERKKKKDIERKAKLDEKRKQKHDEKMKKYSPLQRRLMNAAVYLVILILVLLLAWQTYRWYIRTQRNIQERMKTKTATSEYMHREFDIED
ncbi:hypothetical protein DLAC_01375 [Tieghemostelium lacteum]|uniref:Transmembrane protein n=1 Tax=Tieghemostelium lacteum TaxID=361077 RepID=A0A152A8G3_TIELA|nr:hypothetical protein DLAC_01375 [Tieghemostelium lacteum]|eukprot:KYR02530.1 hypothetical protein DLAC_01375 [Tieghemostelium lacteum]